jgi:hypothetical protein
MYTEFEDQEASHQYRLKQMGKRVSRCLKHKGNIGSKASQSQGETPRADHVFELAFYPMVYVHHGSSGDIEMVS